jgi:tungstate transport system substrate-binding protein
MLNKYFVILFIGCLLVAPGVQALAAEHLRLATTTSTENSGLLAELLPPFEQSNDCSIDVIAVGTGKAIRLGKNGDVDVVMVHARDKEDEFVAQGYGVERRDLMYNDFVILGPADDPAGIKGESDVAVAMAKIAATGSTFFSRGDDSGTHSRERQLWEVAGVTPAGDWYLEAGRGMGEVIVMADERLGYTLSDRGTFLAFTARTGLRIVVEGDRRLFNPYGVIMVNPRRHPHVKVELARKFLDYLISDQTRALISGYRSGGEQLFYVR